MIISHPLVIKLQSGVSIVLESATDHGDSEITREESKKQKKGLWNLPQYVEALETWLPQEITEQIMNHKYEVEVYNPNENVNISSLYTERKRCEDGIAYRKSMLDSLHKITHIVENSLKYLEERELHKSSQS